MRILNFFKNWPSKILMVSTKTPPKNLGRNDPCHCGSGKKYKNCHLKQEQAEVLIQQRDQELANLNRNNEPNWGPLGPDVSIAQKGLANAKETLDKFKR